jgi:Tfp pilus assembly protein FimT
MVRWLHVRREAAGRCRGSRGITAVELMIIVCLLVILGAIAIPTVSPIVLRYRLRGAAWQLAGDLRLARQRAVTLKKRFRICLTGCMIAVPAGTYSVERDVGTPSSPSWVSDTGVATRLPQDIRISASAMPVFSFTGTAAPTASFWLRNPLSGDTQCQASGCNHLTVAITGRVQVCEGTCPP